MYPLIIIILLVLLASVILLPGLWVKRVIKKYKVPEDLFTGTGSELAQHLLQERQLSHVVVEQCKPNEDHYDPGAKAAALTYVAASLASLLSLSRWIAILRR